MGLQLTLECGADRLCLGIHGDVLAEIRSLPHELGQEVAACHGQAEPGVTDQVEAQAVAVRTRDLIEKLKAAGHGMRPVYYLEDENRKTGEKGNIATGATGWIGHEWCSLRVGPDQCEMTVKAIRREDGSVVAVQGQPIDIRSQSRIDTDWAIFYIRQRKKPSSVTRLLKDIARFASEHPDAILSRTFG